MGFIYESQSKTPINKIAETLFNKITTPYLEKYKIESENVVLNFSHF